MSLHEPFTKEELSPILEGFLQKERRDHHPKRLIPSRNASKYADAWIRSLRNPTSPRCET